MDLKVCGTHKLNKTEPMVKNRLQKGERIRMVPVFLGFNVHSKLVFRLHYSYSFQVAL